MTTTTPPHRATQQQRDGSPLSIVDLNNGIIREWKREQDDRDARMEERDALFERRMTVLALFAVLLVVSLIVCVVFASPEFQEASVKLVGDHWLWIFGGLFFSTASSFVVSRFNRIDDRLSKMEKGLREEIRHFGVRSDNNYGSVQGRIDNLYSLLPSETQSGGAPLSPRLTEN